MPVVVGPTGAGKKAFFITPIGEPESDVRKRSDDVLEYILREALVPGIVDSVERADQHDNPGEITPVMVETILDSDLIIADLTDANPNVYYEIAIAHAFNKPTVHIQHKGQELPFDVKDIRKFEYVLDLEGAKKARDAILHASKYALENPDKLSTPVARGSAILQGQRSNDSGQQLAALVATRLDQIEGRLKTLTRTNSGSGRYSTRKLAEFAEGLDDWAEASVGALIADSKVAELERSGEELPRRLSAMQSDMSQRAHRWDQELEQLISGLREWAVNRYRHPARSAAVQNLIAEAAGQERPFSEME